MSSIATETWYLATYPKTVFSIVNTGKVPDDLDNKAIRLFKTFAEALNECPEITKAIPKPDQTFILKLEIPFVVKSTLIEKVNNLQTSQEYLQAQQIDSDWIVSAHVYLKKSVKLFSNLLNSKFKKEIYLDPEEFKPFEKKVEPQNQEEEEKKDPSSSTPLGGLNPHQIIEKQGDLLGSSMQTLVNTINCVGVMGKGIALAFKKHYPAMFDDYVMKCKQHKVKVGVPYVYTISPWRKIVNFPTKYHWKGNSQIKWVEEGLIYLAQNIRQWSITSLALPPLGCGNGGLSWDDEVKPLVYRYLQPLGIEIEIYIPFSAKDNKHTTETSSHI